MAEAWQCYVGGSPPMMDQPESKHTPSIIVDFTTDTVAFLAAVYSWSLIVWGPLALTIMWLISRSQIVWLLLIPVAVLLGVALRWLATGLVRRTRGRCWLVSIICAIYALGLAIAATKSMPADGVVLFLLAGLAITVAILVPRSAMSSE
jgi:Nitrate/nitrite transporter